VTKPSIIVAPHPRSISETFDSATWQELNEIADVTWGRDEPMPERDFVAGLADATAVAFGAWPYSEHVIGHASPNLQALFEMLGTHDHRALDYEACFARDMQIGRIAPPFGPVVPEMCLSLPPAAARGAASSDSSFPTPTDAPLH